MHRVTDVLDAFLDEPIDLGVTEVANITGMSKSATHRVLTALTESGYIAHDGDTHRYRVGVKLRRLGTSSAQHAELRTRAYAYLRGISQKSGETALLCGIRGDSRVYLDQIEAQHPVRTSMPLGQERPLHIGASGKAMLAFIPLRIRQPLVLRAEGTKLADGSVIRAGELETELEQIRVQRFAMVSDELVPGLAAVASPVFSAGGHVVGSLGVAGLSNRTTSTQLAEYADIARTAAEKLSRELGWDGRTLSDAQAAEPSPSGRVITSLPS
jgi:DNA-binding IclR family transcriptional regulator